MTELTLVGHTPTARERKRAEREAEARAAEEQRKAEADVMKVTFILVDGSSLPAGEMTTIELDQQRVWLDQRLGPDGDEQGRRTFQFRGSIVPARSVLRIVAEPT